MKNTQPLTLNPTFFLITVNPQYFQTKMEAIEFTKLVKVLFKEAMIKMVGKHQYGLSGIPNKKFDLKLWGIGRANRDKVFDILQKFA